MDDTDHRGTGAGPDQAAVDVCVCTFRRPSIAATLESLAAQDYPGRWRVLVCDNDDVPSARELVLATAGRVGLPVAYIHAPARNISIARNACLAAARAPLVAFLDDDETAAPHWLRCLVDCQGASGADVVFGPVQALYPAEAPAWARAVDLHSLRPTILADGRIVTGYTCNVLLRRAAASALSFDTELGRTGGEDTVFFDQMGRGGAVMAFCPEALVSEPASSTRTRMGWLLRRSFRSGQTHGRLLLERGRARPPQIALAAVKTAFCLAQAVAGCGSLAWRRALVRGALHAGVAARLAGVRELRLY